LSRDVVRTSLDRRKTPGRSASSNEERGFTRIGLPSDVARIATKRQQSKQLPTSVEKAELFNKLTNAVLFVTRGHSRRTKVGPLRSTLNEFVETLPKDPVQY